MINTKIRGGKLKRTFPKTYAKKKMDQFNKQMKSWGRKK